MMNFLQTDILQPLYGALRLAMFDTSGLMRMDDSRRGLWISFAAPLLALLLMIVLPTLQGPSAQLAGTSDLSWLRDALSYLIAIFGFPLAMHYVCRYLMRGARYHLLVAAVNWTTPWQVVVMGIAYVIYGWNVVPEILSNLILLAASTYNMIYIWFTVRTALTVTRGMAVLLVILMAAIQMVGWLLTQITL